MPNERQFLGRDGEDLAARHLESKGYRILTRRYRSRFGEVDLVAAAGRTLVFVEVKARRGTGFGSPEESVHALKQARIAKVAAHYLAERRVADVTCRFDVIAITWRAGEKPAIQHIEDAFRPAG